MKTQNYNKTRIKNIQRYEKQVERINKLERAYNTHNDKYYAKAKRQDLIGNQFSKARSFNPYTSTDKDLKATLTYNAQAIRELGYNSNMAGDFAEALVLTELNNEAYFQTSHEYEDSGEYEAFDKQSDIMGEILQKSLQSLRLSDYQLERIFQRSTLPSDVVNKTKESLKGFYKKLRR